MESRWNEVSSGWRVLWTEKTQPFETEKRKENHTNHKPSNSSINYISIELNILNKNQYGLKFRLYNILLHVHYSIRYLMLILKEEEVYFLDRDNSVFETDKFYFPRRKNPDEHICNTLVDGVKLSCFISSREHITCTCCLFSDISKNLNFFS